LRLHRLHRIKVNQLHLRWQSKQIKSVCEVHPALPAREHVKRCKTV
jgi:hypothetical protein